MITLTPAYGRDYKSKKALLTDWNSGMDFIIADVMDPYCGKPANCNDLDGKVRLRYDKLRKSMVVYA